MQFSLLAALFAAGAAASPMHGHAHSVVHQRRDADLSPECASRLSALGLTSAAPNVFGLNALESGSSGVWIGSDGEYTNEFINHAHHEVCLVLWGSEPSYQASFVKAVQPLIAVSLPAHHGKKTISFASGQSGAWAGVYRDTALSWAGQIANTWGEYTMGPEGAVDVSREVFATGKPMRIENPDCVTDMETCVFKCVDPTATTCGTAGSYTLENCAPGSQPGVQNGMDSTSGGCGWNGKSSVHFKTHFHA